MILMKSYLLDTLDILYSANVFNLMSVLSTAFFFFFFNTLTLHYSVSPHQSDLDFSQGRILSIQAGWRQSGPGLEDWS